MIRRKLTLKRIDPWTVLKFGFVVNVALLIVSVLVFWVVWSAIQRLGLVEQFCGSVGTIVLDLRECSLNFGNIFRTYLFLGMLGVIISTGVMVLASFLYNLIADLTGGLTFTFLDDSGDAAVTTSRKGTAVTAGAASGTVAGKAAGTGASRDPDTTRHAGASAQGSSGSPGADRRPDEARPVGDRPGSPAPATAPASPSSATPPTPSTSSGTAPSTSNTGPSSSRQDRPSSDPSRPTPGSLWGDSTPRDD